MAYHYGAGKQTEASTLIGRFKREGHQDHRELHVSHRFLGDGGSKTLFDWLATNGHFSSYPKPRAMAHELEAEEGIGPPWLLTNIDLNDVSMQDSGFESLTRYLQSVKEWVEVTKPSGYQGVGRVCLRYNHVQGSAELAQKFLSSLCYSRTPEWSPNGVVSLVFSNNPLSVGFRRAFFTMLPDALPRLLELRLDMTGLNTADALALARYIGGDECHKPSKLIRLTASANSMGQRGVDEIVKACQRSYAIEHVELYANGVDTTVEEEDPEDYMPGRPFQPPATEVDSDPLASEDVDRGIQNRVRGSGCGWEALERGLRYFLLRNMHYKSVVAQQALQLLRYSRLILFRGSASTGSPLSSPPSPRSLRGLTFQTLPTEIQLAILSNLAPDLSPAQHSSIVKYATSKSTLPPPPTLDLPSPKRVCIPDPTQLDAASSPRGPGPKSGSLVRGSQSVGGVSITQRGHCVPPVTPCLGTTKTLVCRKEERRLEWLQIVGCDVYDPSSPSL